MSKFINVTWARTHNLKDITVQIPKNKLIVITGVSWSWKSSLAFNTIYSEWQKKYLESLSTYIRMFIGWWSDEADVDEISWLSPTISIDQKNTSSNPRSTVWTITEIYDYYKLLFLHLWDRKCMDCWNIIHKNSLSEIVDDISSQKLWEKFIIKSPILKKDKIFKVETIKKKVLDMWFIRFSVWDTIYTINDDINISQDVLMSSQIFLIIDRLTVKSYSDKESSDLKRLKDSLNTAFEYGGWFLSINFVSENKDPVLNYSNIFVCSECWHIPQKLDISSFSFNSHKWACPGCHGLWDKVVFLEEKLVNYKLTIKEGAIMPWFSNHYYLWILEEVAKSHWFSLDVPYDTYSKKISDLIMYWTGEKMYKVKYSLEEWYSRIYNTKYEWVIPNLTRKFFDSETDTMRLWSFATTVTCPDCNWHRLNSESLHVFIEWKNIWEISSLSVEKTLSFLASLNLQNAKKTIAKNIMKNLLDRLWFLKGVWLSYITIARKANTLSWWESQRIRLATQVWSQLEWIIYVLDEPSIWLHPRDNTMLIENLKRLRDLWNTLIIVEHDEDIMFASDYIFDIWPWAWIHWGEVVAEWTVEEILNNKNSVTWKYLKMEKLIPCSKNREIKDYLRVYWATLHNLKEIDVAIPLRNFVVVTWVSWSWKSSLVNDTIANYLSNKLNRANRTVWPINKIEGIQYLDKVVIIDQSPIGKTPRSNPATYTWVFTHIRDLFSETEESTIRWYAPWRFSFNTKWWRCEACEWDGVKKIEMHFLPPVYVKCESCDWKRFNKETLAITFKWRNIADVLSMTAEEALSFFSAQPKITRILQVLNDVWLWYIKLWQSSTTLSWGEAQRIKLSSELSKKSTTKTFYILDEPTTWLHFQDIEKLLHILHSLVDKWNSVVVIEHNLNVIMNADYIIDIWPEWWDKWWGVVEIWDINTIMKCKKSYTWQAIKQYLGK